jgi:hypothetical protein
MKVPGQPDWERAILCLYYETADGEICGLGNAVVIAVMGDRAIAVTAAHNAAYMGRVAAQQSPFSDLATARAANPRFRSYVKTVHGVRHCGDEQDLVDVPTLRPPIDEDSDVALALVAKRQSSRHELQHAFGIKIVPPALGETVFVVGSHSQELIDVQPLDDGRPQWNFRATAVWLPAQVVAHSSNGPLSAGPAFEVTTELPGGLSGSPVICVRGREALVCGVVSSSAVGSNRGCVAAIWPVLGLTIPTRGPGDEDRSDTPIFEFVRQGVVHVFGNEMDCFELRENGTFRVRT